MHLTNMGKCVMQNHRLRDADAILEARHHDPFSYLGLHESDEKWIARIFQPHADEVWLFSGGQWQKLENRQGIFFWSGKTRPPAPCRIRIAHGGDQIETYDPYTFASSISELDLYLFGEGRLHLAYRMLGAHPMSLEGVSGTRFAVWAPNAERVSVVGDFNGWDGRIHPMRVHPSNGVWEIFIPGIDAGSLYKFEIRSRQSGAILAKTDPYGFAFEERPGTASRIRSSGTYAWHDGKWMAARKKLDWLTRPMNVYEIHAGSWKLHPDGRAMSYRELADALIPYVLEMGYTHIELMPISEHPLDESWGYQTTGYFGITSRYGSPEDFCAFVEAAHAAGIGVILDWVPAHFPRDDFALARFDGTALYEHEDPRLGEHQDWGTYIFNYGRNEVKNFLISNAHFWLSECHIDGLRVDAVASMLYLDYSRRQGEWLPNKYGGRENLDAIEFLRELNIMVHEEFKGAVTIAEESTSWPMVSRPVHLGGLGFSMKWNMGWMNDTLAYMKHDPIHRRFHHDQLTFAQVYSYTENFVLPFSHDEVVHGKKSLLDKMPGDAWQRFANLRLLLAYQMTYPGKKLGFMGNEFAQAREWQVKSQLDWNLLELPAHQGIQKVVKDLNRLYSRHKAMHELDFSSGGFAWIDCHDAEQSILSYRRIAKNGSFLVVVINFTPVPRKGYRIGVPEEGHYREIFNSDSQYYGGTNMGNGQGLEAEPVAWMGEDQSVCLTVPPLACIIFEN